MPRVSAFLVRASLLCLAAGATLGALLLTGKAGWPLPGLGSLLPVHRELLMVGWLVQLALGVGFWILPPVRGVTVRARRAWAVAALLNGGIVLFAAGALWPDAASPGASYLRAAGRALEGLAVLGFAVPLMRRPFR